MCTKKTRVAKSLEEMDVMDDFLFMEIMTDEESGI